MRNISFLLTIFSFFIHQPVFGYTVVLKSGKTVEGARIAEDAYTLQIKDAKGVILSFRKSTLDLEAMGKTNGNLLFEKSQISHPTFRWGEIDPPKPTLVELAELTKKNRRNSQKLRIKDLQHLPALSILGTEELSSLMKESSDQNETQWRRQSRSMREDLDALRQNKIAADAACRKARDRSMIKLVKPRRGSVIIIDPSEEPSECERAKELGKQLQSAQEQYEDFEDRARQAGVPWQWLE